MYQVKQALLSFLNIFMLLPFNFPVMKEAIAPFGNLNYPFKPCTNKYLNKKTGNWPGVPAFVDTSSYVASHHKISFGAECGASVLICPQIQSHCPGSGWPANNGH